MRINNLVSEFWWWKGSNEAAVISQLWVCGSIIGFLIKGVSVDACVIIYVRNVDVAVIVSLLIVQVNVFIELANIHSFVCLISILLKYMLSYLGLVFFILVLKDFYIWLCCCFIWNFMQLKLREFYFIVRVC